MSDAFHARFLRVPFTLSAAEGCSERLSRGPENACVFECLRRVRILYFAAFASLLAISFTAGSAIAHPRRAQMRAVPFATSTFVLVLPPKLMAAHPATLAVFGMDGKLVPGVSVDLSDGESVTTDRTGRAHFTAPAIAKYLLARAGDTTAAALIDPAVGASEPQSVTAPPFVSLRESFWLCGPSLQGDATADGVTIDAHRALVLAASPECLATIAPPGIAPGPAQIDVTAPGVHWTASTVFVSLEFAAPRPALQPGQKGRLTVIAHGSTAKLSLIVENTSPDMLRFLGGDVQQVRTSGGANNLATIQAQAIRSGTFSFHARIVPPSDPAIAARYLQAALPFASRDQRRQVEKLAARLGRRPRNVDSERREIARILADGVPGDFRNLLLAANSAL